ncbi:DUF1311 domain-containing protein [Flammeovirga sp. MY04]|uniref:lysozyme inhibitor LprI family protein n=1 Tax=Flammeovirga sp. MY04 TaxID=1191459 RepID=UPI0008061F05|nr:lysozyme inhibitor LprI family protein [Flammeovirga sp. MY04]ANQ49752.1 DUF1311 domain-containing protein [Flammeovirga sp. MY04]
MTKLFKQLIFLFFITISCTQIEETNEDSNSSSKSIESKNQFQKINERIDCYNGSQLEMNICSLKEFEYYDSLMNKVYNELMVKLDHQSDIVSHYENKIEYNELKSYKLSIIESQKNWMLQRELNALILSKKYSGGTIEVLEMNKQRIIDTQERIQLLEKLFTYEIE